MSLPISLIKHYFPNLTDLQEQQFIALGGLYEDWNAKINVISRKDIGNLYERHILHSLSIAKLLSFSNDSSIMDVGTGGGFPGIPLAIMFPQCQFFLLDSVGKKILVAGEVAKSIGLQNVIFKKDRVENETGKYDFVVSRAVMTLPEMAKLTRKNIAKTQQNALPNGLLMLKGNEIGKEIYPFRRSAEVFNISDWFKEEFFKTKTVVYLPM